MTQGLDVVVKSHKIQGTFAVTADYSYRAHTSEHRMLLCSCCPLKGIVINIIMQLNTHYIFMSELITYRQTRDKKL